MKVALRPIDSVKPYARNPRRNEQAVAKVRASIEAFGFRQPIVVDERGVIIVGHTRFFAAREIGMAKVPVHVAEGLTPEQARAYRLADNRTNQEAEWDESLLALEIGELRGGGFDLSLTGFDPGELGRLLASDGESGLRPGADPDDAPPLPQEAVTRAGDLIRMGRHRLYCGKSEAPESWARLLADADRPVDLVWTDPPYGVSYVGGTKDRLTILNDDLGLDALAGLLRGAFALALARTRPGAAWYVAAPHGPQFLAFAQVLTELRVWRQTIVWVKNHFVLSRADYHGRHEAIIAGETPASEEEAPQEHTPIIYGWSPTGAHEFYGGRKLDTVWEVPRPKASEVHPTMKPVELVRRAIHHATTPEALVVDMFAGSGTTVIAAEDTGRTAYVAELDPKYCDVIVSRWEEATGKRALRPRVPGDKATRGRARPRGRAAKRR